MAVDQISFISFSEEKYVFVQANGTANNIIVVYLEAICEELDLWPGTTSGDTYIPEAMESKEISGNHISYIKSLVFKEENKFPTVY